MKLSQESASTVAGASNSETFEFVVKKDNQEATLPGGTIEKLKASNFPASFLKIGRWEVFTKLLDTNALLFLSL